MSLGFWNTLAKPIIGLAPMDGVTDQPFRYITKKYGNPDVVFTEFTSVEGVCHGANRLLRDFMYDTTQKPIVAQIYGTTPSFFRQTAIILCELGFDGIDINMGCPAKSVSHSGAGAALIKTPKRAQEIIKATKAGVADYHNGIRSKDCPDISSEISNQVSHISSNKNKEKKTKQETQRIIPVSVKTRIGFDSPVINTWIPHLLEIQPAAISLHGRTLKQGYSGRADWDSIAHAANFVAQTKTIILGNGDVDSYEDAVFKTQHFGVDGVLIGRAAFGNPLVFQQNTAQTSKQKTFSHTKPINQQTTQQLCKIALEHAQVYEKTYQHEEKYFFLPMRKHLAWYIKGIPDAKKIRVELMQVTNSEQVKNVFQKYNLI